MESFGNIFIKTGFQGQSYRVLMWKISNVFLTCYIFMEFISFFGHFQILCCHVDMKAQPHCDALVSKLETAK